MAGGLISAQLAWMKDSIFVAKVQPNTMAEADGQWLLACNTYMDVQKNQLAGKKLAQWQSDIFCYGQIIQGFQ